jgi:hypothetical protein
MEDLHPYSYPHPMHTIEANGLQLEWSVIDQRKCVRTYNTFVRHCLQLQYLTLIQ